MKIIERKMITREDYMKLLYSNVSEVRDYIYGIATKSLYQPTIYGFYNPNFRVINGDYYVEWERYNSCD